MDSRAYDAGENNALKLAGVGSELMELVRKRISRALVPAYDNFSPRVLEQTILAHRLRTPAELAKHMGVDVAPTHWDALFPKMPVRNAPPAAVAKLAALRWPWPEEKRWQDTAAPIAAGVAGAAPFAGLIGEKPIIHDPLTNPNIPRVESPAALEALMQPGDIFVAGRDSTAPLYSIRKAPRGSEFFHGGAVLGGNERTKGKPRIVAENDWLRAHAGKVQDFPTMAEAMAHPDSPVVKDMMLLRPTTPYTPEQLQAFEKQITMRGRMPYDLAASEGNWWRDVLLPKLGITRGRTKPPLCEGNICSTTPSMAFEEATGRELLPNVAAHHMSPADILRSENLKPVAAHLSPEFEAAAMSPAARQALRFGSRGLIGLGLAAGAYGATQDPINLAAPAGALALPWVTRKALQLGHHLRGAEKPLIEAKKTLPPLSLNLLQLLSETNPRALARLKRMGLRTLPLTLAGGTGALLLAKKLRGDL